MTTNTKIFLGVAALAAVGVGFYLYQKKKAAPPTSAPATATGAPAAGGGAGANSSTAAAYNGPINWNQLFGGAVDYFTGSGASTGHLPNGNGGATAAAPVDTSGASDGTDSAGVEQYDYSEFE